MENAFGQAGKLAGLRFPAVCNVGISLCLGAVTLLGHRWASAGPLLASFLT